MVQRTAGCDPNPPVRFLQSCPTLRPNSFGFYASEAAVRGHQVSATSRLSRPAASRRVNNIAAILLAPVIEKIFTHLGLQARAPSRAPARGQTLLRAACARQNHDSSLGPAPEVAGIGCARAFQDRGNSANSSGQAVNEPSDGRV